MDNEQLNLAAPEDGEAPATKPVRTRRKKAAEPAESAGPVQTAIPGTDVVEQAAPPAEAAAAKPRTRRTRKAAAPAAEEAPAAAEAAGQPDETAPAQAEPAPEAGEAKETAPKARAPRRRKAAAKPVPEAAVEEAGPAAEPVDAAVAAPAAQKPTAEVPAAGAEPAAAVESAAVEPAAPDTAAEAAATPEAEPAAQEPVAAQPEDTATPPAQDTAGQDTAVPSPFMVPDSPVSLLFHAPDLSVIAATRAAEEEEPEDENEDDDEQSGSRRGRRSRRSRSRGRGESAETEAAEAEEPAEGGAVDQAEAADGVTSRRRRRRRRGDQDLELTGGLETDPPNTVTRVRAPRQSTETAPAGRVASVKGSTRLEAKRQRRRESRESGRRRQVITEAEFLARRESVDRQMVVRQRDERIQIGVLEDGVLAEHFVSKTQQDSLIGNVYLGKVQNVLPSMEAAFVDIGRGRNAVLYAGEVNWDAAHLDGQPRRIELALKSGDSVLVQVTKDPVGHKGARLTSQISLPGRFLVYVPGGSMTGISRKLPDVERNRLKKILKEHVPDGAGVIVRTAAEGASEEELMNDINRLRAQWEGIEARATDSKTLPPELLYAEPDLTIKVVRDVFNEDFSKLIVSGDEAWDTIEAYVTYVAPDLVDRLEKWTAEEDIFAANRIDEQIYKALERKVFLPSGGSLVIDRTEAMTVVDVNTGKFTGSGGNLEETVTKNNLEAAEEVVRQLRLRDIGGIIVIDFIDMVLESNRDLVLRRLVECLGRDRTKHQVAEVTSLGLVQMTRKRMGTGLLEVFGEQCEHCAGRGVITHEEPLEHRRAAVVAEHQHHVQARVEKQQARPEKPSRSEKRRTRGQSQPQVQEQPAAGAHQDDAERQAKARAALANIAAAAHAAHEAEDHAVAQVPEPAGQEHVVEPGSPVLTINGEKVALPRAEHLPAAVVEEPALTLESLTEAFNRVAPAPVVAEPHAGTGAAEGDDEAALRTGRRRGRRHRSASRAQGAANESAVEQASDGPETGQEAAAHSFTAQAPGRAAGQASAQESGGGKPQAEAAKSGPIILGVGVPASEL
ncbi:Rne/Rng family ribonuclease [Arthrobacter sp. I2-34]|uniref:Rne/Rng family ribonuclease n=1 Tax=Arthrobacter hankyongi TaxID=2904801 RepID=A0ABS9LCK2_9MICC|nr:Rne/Rng family ribonuclease [Arthrobacter hankyongi]MCG2624400.1 Rne/Rng family ribonuclease [Arthrobacter hankyongi]